MARPLHDSPLADIPRWAWWPVQIGFTGTAIVGSGLALIVLTTIVMLFA